jgi:deoxycytidylate deaminase
MCQKLINTARKYINTDSKNQHVSLIVYKNKVLSVGRNSYKKTDRFAQIHKFQNFFYIHSELNAIKKVYRYVDLSKVTLINMRFSKDSEQLLMARPCNDCMNLISAFNIKRVIYSDRSGKLVKL